MSEGQGGIKIAPCLSGKLKQPSKINRINLDDFPRKNGSGNRI